MHLSPSCNKTHWRLAFAQAQNGLSSQSLQMISRFSDGIAFPPSLLPSVIPSPLDGIPLFIPSPTFAIDQRPAGQTLATNELTGQAGATEIEREESKHPTAHAHQGLLPSPAHHWPLCRDLRRACLKNWDALLGVKHGRKRWGREKPPLT